jgi:hypothetical protein
MYFMYKETRDTYDIYIDDEPEPEQPEPEPDTTKEGKNVVHEETAPGTNPGDETQN